MNMKTYGKPSVIEAMECRMLMSAGLLSGKVIGTAGSYRGYGNTIAKVFDGNLNSYFDAPVAAGAYVGMDFGSPKVVNQILFAPRPGISGRMIGGQFQGSSTVDFAKPVTLYTINFAPPAGALTSVGFANSAAFRYVRYVGPVGSYCNIAEAEFFTAAALFATVNNSGELVLTGGSGNQIITANFAFADGANPNSAAIFALTDNGRTETFGANSVDELLINSGNGNDQMTISGSAPADLAGTGPLVYLTGGSGNDRFDINIANENAIVTAGDGNDSVVVRGSNNSINVTLGNGNDSLTAESSGGIAHSVNLSAGSGQDVFTNDDPKAIVQNGIAAIEFNRTDIGGYVSYDPARYPDPGPVFVLKLNGNVLESGEIDPLYHDRYSFDDLPAGGSYQVSVQTPAGYKVLEPASGEYDLPAGSLLTGFNFVLTSTLSKLKGTVIGTPGSFRNAGHTIANAADGNLSTYFDGPDSVGDWVGFDFGKPVIAKAVKYAPRGGYADRLIGGQIQASNTPDFSSGVVQLYSVGVTPTGVVTTQKLLNNTAYRYYRYFGPLNAFCDIAELEFDG